jgi:hypothetical protein
MNKCLNCGKDVKNKYCNNLCRHQYKPHHYIPTQESIDKQKKSILEKWKNFNVECFKCGKTFEIKEYNVDKPKKEKYYCSKSCGNSHIVSKETRQKISIGNKNKIPHNISEKILKICPVCESNFYVRQSEIKRIYCSELCYLKDDHCSFRTKSLGGIRKGSGRGKSGWYKGYWSDSSWELAWIIYNIDHNIKFERNNKGFEYIFDDKKHKFYPDFILNNVFYEIKAIIDEKNKCKISQFKEKLIVLDKKDIQPYLKYVIEKHGNNFIELYEGNPHKIKNNKCIICGKDCLNMYCSRLCSGVGVSKLKIKL